LAAEQSDDRRRLAGELDALGRTAKERAWSSSKAHSTTRAASISISEGSWKVGLVTKLPARIGGHQLVDSEPWLLGASQPGQRLRGVFLCFSKSSYVGRVDAFAGGSFFFSSRAVPR
jgi:hypothetical protein